MFSHRSFLVFGSGGVADILSLIKGGLEVMRCEFAFEQGLDNKGKATTKVYGGTIHITLSQLPSTDILLWGMKSRKYMSGAIVMLDHENLPIEKIIFEQAACIRMEVDYMQKGKAYTSTKLIIQSEKIIVGNGIDFMNEWTW